MPNESIFDKLKHELGTRGDVVLVGTFDDCLSYAKNPNCGYSVTFFLAPRNPTYKADELQAAFLGAFPEDMWGDSFPEYKIPQEFLNAVTVPGRLFREKVGKETRTITLSDESLKKELDGKGGFSQGTSTAEERDVVRYIHVWLYPNERLARKALESGFNGSNAPHIESSELKEEFPDYQPRRFKPEVPRGFRGTIV